MKSIKLFGYVGDHYEGEGITAASYSKQMETVEDTDDLNIVLNSPGGSVFEGLTIYQMIASREGFTQVTVTGLAASIASIIAMAADRIIAHTSSRMMIHDPRGPSAMAFGTSEDLRKAAKDTEQIADILDSIADTGVAIYADRTGQDAEGVREMMKKETWMTSKKAKSLGFVDEVLSNKKRVEASALVQDFSSTEYRIETLDEANAIRDLCASLSFRSRREAGNAGAMRLRKAQLDAIASGL